MTVDVVHWGIKKAADQIPARHGIVDCCATTLMSGSGAVKDCVADCRQMGFPVEELEFSRCRRPFRFGDGKIECAQWPRNDARQLRESGRGALRLRGAGRTPIPFP